MDAYVVRIWRPGDAGESSDLRGTAVHLASGRDLTFTEPAALIRFLAAGTSDDTASTSADTAAAGDQLRDNTHDTTKGGQQWFE